MRRVSATDLLLGLAAVTAGVAVVGVAVALTRTDPAAAGRGNPAPRTATGSPGGPPATRAPAPPESPPTTATTAPPAPAVPPLTQPVPVALPAPPGGSVGPGSAGPEVQAYQQRLADLHFDPGPVDGRYGEPTRSAVLTMQMLLGLPTSGRMGPAEVQALSAFRYPEPRATGGEAKRVEIDLARQVLTLYDANQVRLVTRISSGGGYRYCHWSRWAGRTICEDAVTPTGRFEFYTRHRGWQRGDLGSLYNPVYFNRGIAVHGANSVPLRPVSHGCTRITMDVARYFPDLVSEGDAVYVLS